MSVGSKTARVSPPSKRIDNAELFLDKFPYKICAITLVSLLVFAHKSKIAKAFGHDHLNCKHQLNVCKCLLGLEAQILDIAFSSGADVDQKRSAFSQYWGWHFVPLPPLIIISSYIQRYLFYV
jgi:hypothetical protein